MLRPLEKSSSAPSHYSRLFGGPFAANDETHLRELAATMMDVPENRRGRSRQGDLAPSAFVYLGQLLDHDLTRDETRLEHVAHQPLEKTRNLHAARLNLESVYGGCPQESPHLYDLSQSGAETFLIGKTRIVQRLAATDNDFFRLNGKPLLADARNDQHLIIGQLHLVFLKFHNRLVDLIKRHELAGASRPNETVFESARRLSVWHYQWIVRNEFLRWFALPNVVEEIERQGPRFFNPKLGDQGLALPIEFTQAVFRFGHSMVQPQYDINQWIGLVRLRDLIRNDPPGEDGNALAADRVVDWERFTRTWGGNANFAENIDTLISEDMFHLPAAAMAVPFETAPPPLPEMTLVRGSRIGLPTGQEACRAAAIRSIPGAKIGFDDESSKFLRRRGLNEKTPLWYYLLREAELLGIRRFHGGECLGPLGSRIMVEVLLGILRADPNYYLNVDPDWKPVMAVFGATSERRRLDTLRKFVVFAQDQRSL